MNEFQVKKPFPLTLNSTSTQNFRLRSDQMASAKTIPAEILALEGGACLFKPEGMDRDMKLVIAKTVISSLADKLGHAALQHLKVQLVVHGGVIQDVRGVGSIGELTFSADILTIELGRCMFRPEKLEKAWTLAIDRDIINRVHDDLIDAALHHEQRRLKIRGGIIRGVEAQ